MRLYWWGFKVSGSFFKPTMHLWILRTSLREKKNMEVSDNSCICWIFNSFNSEDWEASSLIKTQFVYNLRLMRCHLGQGYRLYIYTCTAKNHTTKPESNSELGSLNQASAAGTAHRSRCCTSGRRNSGSPPSLLARVVIQIKRHTALQAKILSLLGIQ